MSEISFAQDGNITYESFINKYNSDLANTLGNLVNRTVAMTNKYFGGSVSSVGATDALDSELIAYADETVKKYLHCMDIYHNADACDAVMNLAKRCNKYIDETAPWVLAKDENSLPRLKTVLYNLLECIRMLGVMLLPIIPESAASIAAQLGNDSKELRFGAVCDYTVGEAKPLFARIDAEKVLKEIAEEKAKSEKNCENVATLSQISIDDFAKVELKTAVVTACEPVPKA